MFLLSKPSTNPFENAPTLLRLVQGLTHAHLESFQLVLRMDDESSLLICVTREPLIHSDPSSTDALYGYVAPWNPVTETWDHLCPLCVFTTVGELQNWLCERYP